MEHLENIFSNFSSAFRFFNSAILMSLHLSGRERVLMDSFLCVIGQRSWEGGSLVGSGVWNVTGCVRVGKISLVLAASVTLVWVKGHCPRSVDGQTGISRTETCINFSEVARGGVSTRLVWLKVKRVAQPGRPSHLPSDPRPPSPHGDGDALL